MPSIERVYVVEATYAADARERRAPHRAEHLAGVQRHSAAQRMLVAGAYDDMSASLLVLAVASEDEALALVHADVYWREGVWTEVTVRALNRVVPE
jgi:hypothetical protein